MDLEQEKDVIVFKAILEKSQAKWHKPSAIAECECQKCSVRRFGGYKRRFETIEEFVKEEFGDSAPDLITCLQGL